MDGLLPPNVSLHDTDLLSDGIDTEVRLHVGASAGGGELVVWLDVDEAGSRRLEHVFSTPSPKAAADSFNARLEKLGSEGFEIGDEVEVDDIQLIRAMPTESTGDGPASDGGEEDGRPRPGGQNLLYD